jgi:hypothetical protein
MATGRLLLASLATLALAPFGAADDPPTAQRDQQRRVQAEVEQTARRVTTTHQPSRKYSTRSPPAYGTSAGSR